MALEITPAGAAVDNPTALVGLTPVNGSLATAMRSDGAPALDQSISPIWTGVHEFDQFVTISDTTTPTLQLKQTALGKVGTLSVLALSGNRAWNLPDKPGTIAMLTDTVQIGSAASPATAGKIAAVNQAGVVANVASTIIANAFGAGMYELYVQLACTVIGATGPQLLATWASDGGTKTNIPITAPLSMAVVGNIAAAVYPIYLSSGNITWSTSGWVSGTYVIRLRCAFLGP